MTRTMIVALTALLSVSAAVAGRAADAAPIEKVDAILAKARMKNDAWNDTHAALSTVHRDQKLQQALALSNDRIVIGTRSGAGKAERVVMRLSSPLGLAQGRITTNAKTVWREELAITPRGLEIHKTTRTAEPKPEYVREARKAMAGALAGAISLTFMQQAEKGYAAVLQIPLEHEALGAEQHDTMPVKSKLISRELKLDASEWGHVTPKVIDDALAEWNARP